MDSPKHLNALRAFEASARHQSFSAAATELNVTSAAVGQLVRTLEDVMGVTLFYRSSSGKQRLKLTEAGEVLLPDIQTGFSYINQAIHKVKLNSMAQKLTVAISPTFATKWLLPKIDNFQRAYPEIKISFDTDLKPIDFNSRGIDIAVRYGAGNWEGLVAQKLMEEEIYPVCSPSFYQQHQAQLLELKNIVTLPLIHCHALDRQSGFITWQTWLDEHNIQMNDDKGFKINNSAAVLQLAMDGHGIALARSVIAHDDVKAARLIHLFPDIKRQCDLAYYLVYREECCELPKIEAFRTWITSEIEMLSSGSGY
ncbi:MULTISPECIES: transcriptional regulator GcvA [unclassified Acinetobacter]|uniref:transcriptional regulator GcvA n=1 Tax=unclassified Acinetobacter TaxID=196816 RepID=UPI0029344683|nr:MULTISPECIES: transcriptional regulator GcvA [unclassified Acinetobacter]WOE32492.1 transcriptional regulator GcvA [Acinetobacter sp. SAAs470]WOE37968.1 transcriptional regulator GcvA [Acinetobacter sp. SAAs474]